MTAFYVGVKKVTAWPQTKDGEPGYAVKYEDGYISWSPKAVFEKSYFELADPEGNSLKENDINRFITDIKTMQLDSKTTLVSAELSTGFKQHETSSCVDPKNYDHELGTKYALGKVKDTAWKCLGFVLQWGKYGLKPEENRMEL